MSLLDAKPEDPSAIRRRALVGKIVVTVVVLAIIAAPLAWWFRYWPEERLVDKFLTAVEQKDYKTAFALWNADAQWEQHLEKYSGYTFGQFQLDWGPSGDWGEIKSHKIAGSVAPRSKVTEVSGVVVAAQINGRAEPACLWVEKKAKTINFSHIPCSL
jgi:hypothetical protein